MDQTRETVRQVGHQHRLGPQRDPSVDEAVLQATRQLLVELGYGNTSIERVARRAAVSRPAIYRRWPSKAHLVHEAVFPPVDVDQAHGDSFVAEIEGLVRGTVQVFAEPATREAVPGLMMEMRADPALQSVLAERLEHAARRRFRDETLEPAVEAGEARPEVDPDTVFDALAGATVFALCIRDEQDIDRFSSALADLLLYGCATDRR